MAKFFGGTLLGIVLSFAALVIVLKLVVKMVS